MSFGGITIVLCLSKTYKDRSLYSFDSFEVRITSPLLEYEKSNFLNDVFIRECQAILKTKKDVGHINVYYKGHSKLRSNNAFFSLVGKKNLAWRFQRPRPISCLEKTPAFHPR